MGYLLLHVSNTVEPNEFKVAKAQYDWVNPPPNTEKGEPTFYKSDNPEVWSNFGCRPVFLSVSQGGHYKAHCLPSVFQTVPINEDNSTICTHVG